MSSVVDAAVDALSAKVGSGGIEGSVKFVIEDEGAIRVDEAGVSQSDADADCTISASSETFQALFAGDLDPTSAFMSGRLRIEGDMGMAMRLATLLA